MSNEKRTIEDLRVKAFWLGVKTTIFFVTVLLVVFALLLTFKTNIIAMIIIVSLGATLLVNYVLVQYEELRRLMKKPEGECG